MPIRHAIWKVGSKPEPLGEASLDAEQLLERMILDDAAAHEGRPTILSDRWMLIGHQVVTDYGGRIDLLALDQSGQLIVVELKRDKTPRDVVAQGIDYASWIQTLTSDRIARIYADFSKGEALSEAFTRCFSATLDEEQLNGSHQVVVVASTLDASTERIVNYLNKMDVPINVIFFQVFQDGATQYLSRAWLIDPIETELKAATSSLEKIDWNQEYYVSFGQGESRDWDEAVRYGFISGGGGRFYSQTLSMLAPGDRVWVNVPGQGYVGVGLVTGTRVRLSHFFVLADGAERPFLEISNRASHLLANVEDEERSEYFVPIQWIETKPLSNSISELGFFGNQNTVCRPRTSKWAHTVERLRHHFPAAASSTHEPPENENMNLTPGSASGTPP